MIDLSTLAAICFILGILDTLDTLAMRDCTGRLTSPPSSPSALLDALDCTSP